MNPFLQWGVWLASAGLELFLLRELIRNGLPQTYPFFTIFIGWQAAKSLCGMVAFRLSTEVYFKVFWLFEIVAWTLIFLFVLEAYHRVLERYAGFRKLSDILILCVGVGLMAAVGGSVLFAQLADPQPTQWLNNWLYLMRRSVRLVHAGFLLALVLFLAWFRIRTTFLLRYLVLGLLVSTVLQVAVAALRYQLGPAAYSLVSWMALLSYFCILLFWCWAVRQSQTRQEQEFVPVFTLRRGREEEELVLARLGEINASVMKAFRQ